MYVCVIIIKKENVEGTFLNGLQVDFSRSLKGKYSMKRIFDETNLERNNWNVRMKFGIYAQRKTAQFYFTFLSIQKFSYSHLYVFPLIQTWKMSRNFFFFLSFIDIFKRVRTRKYFFVRGREKFNAVFATMSFLFVIYGATFYHYCYWVGISQLNHVATTRATDEVGRNGGGTSV